MRSEDVPDCTACTFDCVALFGVVVVVPPFLTDEVVIEGEATELVVDVAAVGVDPDDVEVDTEATREVVTRVDEVDVVELEVELEVEAALDVVTRTGDVVEDVDDVDDAGLDVVNALAEVVEAEAGLDVVALIAPDVIIGRDVVTTGVVIGLDV